jgi:hypothetical protein
MKPYGAALLVGVGTQVWSDVATPRKQVIEVAQVTSPDERQAK